MDEKTISWPDGGLIASDSGRGDTGSRKPHSCLTNPAVRELAEAARGVNGMILDYCDQERMLPDDYKKMIRLRKALGKMEG